jgi:hypothetical protein
VTTPLRSPDAGSKYMRRDAKRDYALIACLNFAAAIGGPGYLDARRALEKAACELAIAEREVEASKERKR